MNIELIPATEKDREFFRKTHHLAYRQVIESMFKWDEKEQAIFADRDFDERNPHIIIFDKQYSGVVGWQDKSEYIWFGPIFILPQYQNKGIGSLLVKQFMDKADSQNLPLRLQTLRKNERAKVFYKKLGFKVIDYNNIHWQMEYRKS